ncbi:MAG: hypothetical protein MOGMAGMI_01825 [Candidatus Omnitrophica bacterium]|nr:hypothetical protein [Ignavibacteriaceae bacterium]MCG3176861.1 hypothetical protein [Candidatus Omnitrophota bacterium]
MKGFFLIQVELPEELNKETSEAILHAMAKQLNKDLEANSGAKMKLIQVSIEDKKGAEDVS